MVKLILVRHGESVANKRGIYQGQTYDTGLTLRGKKQLQLLAEVLKSLKVDKIFTSSLLRTRQTAKILADQLDAPILVDERIIEISHGKWEGKHKTWVEENYPALIKLWRNKPTKAQMPVGENLAGVYLRTKNFLDEIKNKLDDHTVVVVGHDLIIRIIISIVLGSHLDRIWRFRLDNGGITVLRLDPKSGDQLIVLNQNNHLKKCLSDIDSQAL